MSLFKVVQQRKLSTIFIYLLNTNTQSQLRRHLTIATTRKITLLIDTLTFKLDLYMYSIIVEAFAIVSVILWYLHAFSTLKY